MNSNDLNDLYQEVIVEHARRPRFKHKPAVCRFCQEGVNPSCGDTLTVFCEVEHQGFEERLSVTFDGVGCSISQASASMMCEALQSVTLAQTQDWIQKAEGIYTGKHTVSADDLTEDIEALHGVSKFPVRIKCAALAWKTLEVLLAENFDRQGLAKVGCDALEKSTCRKEKKLRIVSTE